MSLYLCVFKEDEEIEGVEVGSYADFNFFREGVVATVEEGRPGSVCPVLINHSDCDGSWSPAQAASLMLELAIIERTMKEYPPVTFNSSWKEEVARTSGIVPTNFLECFFDVDGEPLLARLNDLAAASVKNDAPILFQ
jgi:immunity protein 70 of polymorphic toxin system